MSRLRPREGWFSLILLIMMLLTVAWAIEAAEWADGLGILQGIVLIGVLMGFVLSKLPIPDLIAHFISITAGVGWSMIMTGRLLEPQSITHQALLDEKALTWRVRLTEVIYRVQTFIEIARTEGVGQDNLVFILQLAFLIWLVSYAAAWFLLRLENVWGAIVPPGFALLLNLYYAPPDLYLWMALYLLCALLLIVRSNTFRQEREWQLAQVSYSPDIRFDFLRDGAIFTLLVILFAWFAPTTAAAPRLAALADRVNAPIYRFQREFNRLYASLNYKSQPGPAYFGDTMTLSGAVSLGNEPVFDAFTDKGRYWRGVVYDQYTGRGWINTAQSFTGLDENDERLSAFGFQLRETVTQTVRVLQPGVIQLHALPQPIRVVDVPARVQFYEVPETSPNGEPLLDVSVIQSRRPLEAGESYTIVSSVSVADIQSLREAGTDYPAWIKERYLQLPEDFPQRVRELAQEITAGKETPYDKVVALETYLRRIKYDEQIPAPPPGKDSVEWFLFEQKSGYCDYYASALVTMARSLGIPARMAAGYSRGEFDAELVVYRQREYDAHSWPEVFFPKYGWIEFEPTAADPRILRPTSHEGDDATGLSNLGPEFDPREDMLLEEEMMNMAQGIDSNFALTSQQGLGIWMYAILGLLGLAVVGMLTAWVFWNRGLRDLSLASAMYARMVRVASWLGLPAHPHQTPHEYAGHLTTVIPEGQSAISHITDIFVLERFADISLNDHHASTLREAWAHLRRLMTGRFIASLIQRITRRGG